MAPSGEEEMKMCDDKPEISPEDESMSSSEGLISSQHSEKMSPQKSSKTKVTGEASVDKPMSEKRERKKVINFVVDSPVVVSKKLDFDQGSGVPLEESPYINRMITVTKSEELKFFHKILYLWPGTRNEIRKNIRKFKGFDFSKDSEQFQDLIKRINRLKSKSMLVAALGIVGLSVTGSREDLTQRLATFLVSPTLVARTIPGKKGGGKKRSSKTKAKKGNTKTKSPKTVKKANTKQKKVVAENESSEAESSGDESDSEPETDTGKPTKRKKPEQDGSGSDSEDSEPQAKKKSSAKKREVLPKEDNSDDEAPEPQVEKKSSAKKRKVSPKEEDDSDDESPEPSKPQVEKKSSAKKRKVSPKEDDSDDEAPEPQVEKKSSAKKRKVLPKQKDNSDVKAPKPSGKRSKKVSPSNNKEDEDAASDCGSDDELLIKKVKPSDSDIEAFIQRYMKSINLEEVTMKNIYQKVCDEFPSVDLASSKDFIKSTVKQILAG